MKCLLCPTGWNATLSGIFWWTQKAPKWWAVWAFGGPWRPWRPWRDGLDTTFPSTCRCAAYTHPKLPAPSKQQRNPQISIISIDSHKSLIKLIIYKASCGTGASGFFEFKKSIFSPKIKKNNKKVKAKRKQEWNRDFLICGYSNRWCLAAKNCKILNCCCCSRGPTISPERKNAHFYTLPN